MCRGFCRGSSRPRRAPARWTASPGCSTRRRRDVTHPQRTPGDGHLMNGGAVNGGDEKPGPPLAKQQPPLTAFQAAFRNLIDQNVDGVLVVRRDGTIAFVNPAAEALLGRSRNELIGHPFGVPVTPGSTTEVDLIRPDGEARSAEMRTVSIMWDGHPATLASLRD